MVLVQFGQWGIILDIGIAGSIVLLVLLNVWDAAHSLFCPTSATQRSVLRESILW
jgi:hypothetical protein